MAIRNGNSFDNDLFGTFGDDTINGFGGSDDLFGGAGRDRINGGSGDDDITGGRGFDTLTGGTGRDDFIFNRGDSGPSFSGADIITDFNSRDDDIVFNGNSPAGNFNFNYHEESFFSTGGSGSAQTYNQALSLAQQDIGGNTQYAFYTDGRNGYLFADLDHNGTVDTGIELRGLTSVNQFSATDIF
jgi:hypothetical protein